MHLSCSAAPAPLSCDRPRSAASAARATTCSSPASRIARLAASAVAGALCGSSAPARGTTLSLRDTRCRDADQLLPATPAVDQPSASTTSISGCSPLRLTCNRCELPITLAALHFMAHLSGWPGPGSRGRAGTRAGALPRRPCVAHALPGPPTCWHRRRPLADAPSPAAARTHFKILVHKHWSV